MFIYGADDAVGWVVFFVRYTSPDLFLALTSLCVRTTRYICWRGAAQRLSFERTNERDGIAFSYVCFWCFKFFSHIHDASAWPRACLSCGLWQIVVVSCVLYMYLWKTNNTFLFGRQWLCERRRLRLVKDQEPHVFLSGDMLTTMMWFNIDSIYGWVPFLEWFSHCSYGNQIGSGATK